MNTSFTPYPPVELLRVNEVTKAFRVRGGWWQKKAINALNGVSFSLQPGETLGLVGESGCGKSTIGRVIMRLLEPTTGSVAFRGQDTAKLNARGLANFRRAVQIVFQDPYSSLNPRITARKIIAEPIFAAGSEQERRSWRGRVDELLNVVGLSPDHADRYPHEFSGGQRQRIGIARALALNPDLLILDEPVSALDVSLQAQILMLLTDLQRKTGIAFIFISHDLGVVRHLCHRVAVMYMGRVVEEGGSDELFNHPRHPYTKALLSAVPIADPDLRDQIERNRIVLQGDVPSPSRLPSGCHFRTRCWRAQDDCERKLPDLDRLQNGTRAACLHPLEAEERPAMFSSSTAALAEEPHRSVQRADR